MIKPHAVRRSDAKYAPSEPDAKYAPSEPDTARRTDATASRAMHKQRTHYTTWAYLIFIYKVSLFTIIQERHNFSKMRNPDTRLIYRQNFIFFSMLTTSNRKKNLILENCRFYKTYNFHLKIILTRRCIENKRFI
jgi:hypothetical protein